MPGLADVAVGREYHLTADDAQVALTGASGTQGLCPHTSGRPTDGRGCWCARNTHGDDRLGQKGKRDSSEVDTGDGYGGRNTIRRGFLSETGGRLMNKCLARVVGSVRRAIPPRVEEQGMHLEGFAP